MIPVSFDHCFGWLHEADAANRSARGVVLMSPFAFEELCARKPFALLAQALAARGIATLRFDWSGTGDSLGGPLDPALLETWRGNAQSAIDTLKAQTGVTEIVLVGMRLGAWFAADAASARDDVRRLVMIAPPASGKSWLRETAAFGKIMTAPGMTDETFDGVECAGFRISAETAASIKTLKWSDLERAPAALCDILDLDNSPASGKISQCLQILGATVTSGTFAGYDGMICDPTASEIPLGTLEGMAARIAAKAPHAEAALAKPAFTPLTGHGFAEAPARIGETGTMAGILCTPLKRTTRSEAVIFLNAGAIPHIGWARMNVDLSRRLARHGVASLRLDLPGIGDSATPSDPPIASPYGRKMNSEVSKAIAWLKDRGYRRVTLAGACSGAYQAFHASLSDERVDALVLLNQLCFVWGKSYSLQMAAWQTTKMRALQLSGAGADAREASRTMARLLPVAKKVAKGSLSALMSLQAMAANALAREKPVEAAFIKLSSRGARVLLAYSAGDPGLAELERHLGPEGIEATSLVGVSKVIIDNADHMLSPMRAREVFADHLVAFLDTGNAEAIQPGLGKAIAAG